MNSLAIGRLAQETGVNVETIRYYERIGLLPKPPRSAGGQRLYDEQGVRRLRFVRRARELGFSLDEIGSLLDMSERSAACADVHTLTAKHLDDVRAKIADLRRMERTLARAAESCVQNASDTCPVIDSLSR